VLFAVVLTSLVSYEILSTRNAWQTAVDEADRLDPRWRLAELQADRPALPDAENSAPIIIAAYRKAAGVSVGGFPRYEKIFEKLPPTARLNDQQILLIRTALAKLDEPLRMARKLKDMPHGRYTVVYSDDYFSTIIGDHQNTRALADWLQHDAWLLAQEQQCDAAVESCQAMLNASRTMSGELTMIAHLIRIAIQNIALTTLERVLAQGEVSEERLRDMQTIIEKEIQECDWVSAVRGERAGDHHLFTSMRDGKLKTPIAGRFSLTAGPIPVRGNPTVIDLIEGWIVNAFPRTLLKYYPDHLRRMTRCVEIARLPIHERGAKIVEWQEESRGTRNPITRLLTPALVKIHQAECRSQALLRSTLVALACERYRIRHKDWPAALDALGKEKFLAAIPADPMDNQPLRYRRTKEGIVIYSIGIDKVDNQGHIDRDRPNQTGVDIGFHLWNEDGRRLAPLPPVALPEAGAPR